jgi:hypothetical protein
MVGQQLRLGTEPVIHIVTMPTAALDEKLMGSTRDDLGAD